MLDSIEKNNKTISEAYRGKELVWQLPTVMTSDIDLYSGIKTIRFITYPARCNVVVTINQEEVANVLSSPSGLFSFFIDSPLKKNDYVVIEITKPGWRKLRNAYSI